MSALETMNANGVTAFQGYVVAVVPLPQRMTRNEALRLAAWLIVASELVDVEARSGASALEDATDTVQAIRST